MHVFTFRNPVVSSLASEDKGRPPLKHGAPLGQVVVLVIDCQQSAQGVIQAPFRDYQARADCFGCQPASGRTSQIVRGEAPHRVLCRFQSATKLVEHGVQSTRLKVSFPTVVMFAPQLTRWKHERRTAGERFQFRKPTRHRRVKGYGVARLGLGVGVRHEPQPALKIHMRPFRPCEFANADTSCQQNFHRQRVLLADRGKRGQDHP